MVQITPCSDRRRALLISHCHSANVLASPDNLRQRPLMGSPTNLQNDVMELLSVGFCGQTSCQVVSQTAPSEQTHSTSFISGASLILLQRDFSLLELLSQGYGNIGLLIEKIKFPGTNIEV